jgi:type I restriction enzyme M protein
VEKELNVNSRIIDLLRDDYRLEELDSVIAKYYTLAFCSINNEIIDVSIDAILRSSEMRRESEKVFLLIEEKFPALSGVFSCLNNDKKMTDKTFYQLLSLIKGAKLSREEWKRAFEDALNKIYDAAGKEIGQSTTPNFLNKLGIELLSPVGGDFYDGASGINGTLIEANKFSKKYGEVLELYGQEINPVVWAIGRIRLFINGVRHCNVELGNTLEKPLFIEINSQLKQFDNIMMNFPFGLAWNKEESSIEKDEYNRFIFGKPARSSSEWLFISHIIKSLKNNGKAIAITSSGTLFRSAGDGAIREKVIFLDYIEAVISLPSSMFLTTSIPVYMIIINMNKEPMLKDRILFVNAENMYENINRNQKALTDEHINRIVEVYRYKKEEEEFSAIIDIKDLDESNLLPSRYIVRTEINNDYFGKIRFNKEKLSELKECKTLGEISEFYRGINITGENTQDDNGEYRIINLADVKEGEIDTEALTRYTIKNNARVEAYMIKEGDIIISNRGMTTKICIIPKHDGKVLISQNFIGIRLNKNISPEYVKEFLVSPLGQFLIASKQVGTSIITLNPKDLKQLPIVLPPINKQLKAIEEYKKEDEMIRNLIKQLERELKSVKIELYDKMGIASMFNIL